jgi:hypothetical protein
MSGRACLRLLRRRQALTARPERGLDLSSSGMTAMVVSRNYVLVWFRRRRVWRLL